MLVLCLGLRTCALRTTPSVQPRARSPPAGPRVSLPLFTLFYYFYRRGRVVTWSATRHVTRSRWRMSSSSFASLSLFVLGVGLLLICVSTCFRGLPFPPLVACRSDSRFVDLSQFASVEARRLVFFGVTEGRPATPPLGCCHLPQKFSRRTSRGVSRFRTRLNIYICDFAAIFICSQYLG